MHDERDPEALRTLMDWKSAQYRRTGRSDRFAHPWITHLVQQLFHTRSEQFAGILSVLYADGRPVAGHFGLRSGRVLACWFPAYDPAFSKYSPGLILHLRMAEAAAADGIAYLDLGRGQKEYKDSLKTRELAVSEGWVTRRHPIAIGHRARRAPVRALRNAVLARPELFEAGRQDPQADGQNPFEALGNGQTIKNVRPSFQVLPYGLIHQYRRTSHPHRVINAYAI